jgi:enterochelin esterase family protein
VLYLFHGTGDTEATWTEFGHAHLILDNLLAEHQCCPMIIVMPDGHADLKEEEGIHKANFLKFEKDVVESVLPMVDKTYRSQPTPAGRAISGLSMGGMQALQIGLNHADLFGSIGAMSAYVPEPDDLLKPRFANTTESAAHQFLWAQIGRDDYLRAETEKFHDLLAKHGIQQQLTLTDGSHEWTVWRKYLDDFAKVVFRPTGKS